MSALTAGREGLSRIRNRPNPDHLPSLYLELDRKLSERQGRLTLLSVITLAYLSALGVLRLIRVADRALREIFIHVPLLSLTFKFFGVPLFYKQKLHVHVNFLNVKSRSTEEANRILALSNPFPLPIPLLSRLSTQILSLSLPLSILLKPLVIATFYSSLAAQLESKYLKGTKRNWHRG
ncbi:hypothetical protein GGR58DRAFT_431703 [Xylaria digitata]|nr:hypothetical protein GGR58DRAFT_431703 [Xylaria digitata]